MNHTQLTAFRAVAEAGGFSRGAEQLMVSQPAVSLQVAQLETAIGTRLFDRLPRGVRLTAAGDLLLGYCRRLGALESEAEQAVRDLQGLVRGKLVIGASLTIGSYVLPKFLGEYSQRFPGIELDMEMGNTEQIERKLLDDALDLGFTEGLSEHDQLQSRTFHSDELVAICRAGHPILKVRPLTARVLFRQPLILREKGSGTREFVEDALLKRKIVAKPIMSVGSTEAIKKAVETGVGIAVVSKLAIESELSAGTLAVIPLATFTIPRHLHLVKRKGKSDSAAAREFMELLRPQKTTPR